ncbi:MAG: hypothetical protein QOJ65_101 [Fimbriimonadaceae bacterium]|jgi:uncharacterized protein YoxC|nr:hypothetical protein [Fimbriimonadaceae bacterium]
MNEIPGWWLGISAAFFVVNILLFIGLVVFLFMLMKWMKELHPKIEALTQRVESIGKNVEELTVHVKTTAESLGGRAKSVASSVDSIAHVASTQFERFSPYAVGALTAIRLIKALTELKRGRSVSKATSRAALEDGKADKTKRGKASKA